MSKSAATRPARRRVNARGRRKPLLEAEPRLPFPEQHQVRPGIESKLRPLPRWAAAQYRAAGKLEGKVALITGGDSGIGRAVAFLYAREGADVAINYLPAEQKDALEVQRSVEAVGRRCLLLPGDLTRAPVPAQLVEKTVTKFGRLDILVSNAAYQTRKKTIARVTDVELDRTFQTNVYACFRLVRAAVRHLQPGASIIVTSSVTGLFGSKELLEYSATKGAINAFIKALSMQLLDRGIRVNAVAPEPVWTPLNPADPGLSSREVAKFGAKTPIGRPAQPEELAPSYVFLASDADSSYITGIVLPVMGGDTTGG